MTTIAENQRLKRLEARLLAGVTDEERASYRWFKGATPAECREADRRLHARAVPLRKRGCRLLALQKALGVSSQRLHRLLARPPPSEEQVQQREAELAAREEQRETQRKAWLKEMQPIWDERDRRDREERKMWRVLRKQQEHEERLDTIAWAKNCLIEAFEDMRGHPILPVVLDA